ncbi:MAG: 2-isopropylmalate synthase, partial [Betaproteobacteria bacterium]|nr:2-isopropylmalate synthase [Betaproteobacteria bacterium]
VECTINGIGERAGNAALEEIVMAVRTRADLFGCHTQVDTAQLVPTSRLVASITGMPVQPNKAIVGANAFAHESGIHQDGVLKSRENYEIMRAEDVGWSSNRLQLGKLSGRNALRDRLAQLGFAVAGDELGEVFARFKRLADKKREIFDDDLIALVTETAASGGHELVGWSCSSGSEATPQASVTVRLADGSEQSAQADGDGQVDAMFRAIEQIVGIKATLESYAVQAVTGGTDAQGEVLVRLSRDQVTVSGRGSDTDIVAASGKAYLDALARLDVAGRRRQQAAVGSQL